MFICFYKSCSETPQILRYATLSLIRLSSETLPVHENTLSDEADEAGANFDSLGYVPWCSFQNFKTSTPLNAAFLKHLLHLKNQPECILSLRLCHTQILYLHTHSVQMHNQLPSTASVLTSFSTEN